MATAPITQGFLEMTHDLTRGQWCGCMTGQIYVTVLRWLGAWHIYLLPCQPI